MDARLNSREAERAVAAHAADLEACAAYRSDFDRLLLTYLELSPRSGASGLRDGRRSAMIQALDRRATWDQIRDWRHGYRRAPAWANYLIKAKLARRRSAIDKVL